MGSSFLNQISNPYPLQWRCRVLNTGLKEKSPEVLFEQTLPGETDKTGQFSSVQSSHIVVSDSATPLTDCSMLGCYLFCCSDRIWPETFLESQNIETEHRKGF